MKKWDEEIELNPPIGRRFTLEKSTWTNDPNQYDVIPTSHIDNVEKDARQMAAQSDRPVKFAFNKEVGELQTQINPDGSKIQVH